ncbi:MATE family efflux transporter [Calycomorphotria hydatis]|uniref:Multidrug-efflux transporter n=1 Tax=Calycomorphotria hydatis TaxID=2528027 RepID=A0A517T9P8_9PLAN|nr:MATE family efflux transporter [Calycomorphotria hydatis]QDT65095.1 Multidrug resistance protein MdtK [Calycomorphotria hydatis]
MSDNLTRGPIRSQLFFLALPVLAEQMLSFLVSLTDTFLSGQLGAGITNAVGLAAYTGWLSSLVVGQVGVGTTALVSRFWGADDRESANHVLNQSLLLGIAGAILFSCFIYPAAPYLAAMLHIEGADAEVAVRYLRLDIFGHLAMGIVFVVAAGLRGAGDMKTALWILGTVNAVNVLVSCSLVYGCGPLPEMAADGIIWGTVAAKVLGGVLSLAVLAGGRKQLWLNLTQILPQRELAVRILRIGIPASLDGAILGGGHFIFLKIIAETASGTAGEALLAAHIIGVRVEAITYLPAVAWGAAASTMVGQALGADRPHRAQASGHEAALQCSIAGMFITALFFFGAQSIYEVMHRDIAVQAVGIPAFRVLAFFQIPLMVSIVYTAALRGAGDTRWPLMTNILGILLMRLPFALIFGPLLSGGLIGVWVGMYADISFRAIMITGRYWFGKWTRTTV